MKPFLQQLADELFDTYGEEVSKLCLVFPNRRAGLYFRRYLAGRISKPLWSPAIYSIEDFVALKSGLQIVGQPALLINLYTLYFSLLGEKARPLKDFITWGSRLLSDFDEIDQYLVDGVSVFSYLTEAKAIEHWNPDGKALTDFEKSYLEFYNSIAPLYAQFRAELLNSNQAYMGLAFRRLIENLETTSFDEWQKIVFAGFNALTPVEEKLFTALINSGKARIFWDADNYYVDDENHEAGLFLRKYRNRNLFGPMNWISGHYKEEEREINIAGIPKNIGQAKFAGQLLSRLSGDETGKTAVVLVDEGLLIPVLNSIPAGITDFNVTMGFPLKLTPAYSLADAIFTLLLNSEKYASGMNDQPVKRFYRQDILRLLKHPYLIQLSGGISNTGQGIEGKLTCSFYPGNHLIQFLEKNCTPLCEVFGPYISNHVNKAQDTLALVQRAISLVKNSLAEKNPRNPESDREFASIDMEYLFSIAGIIQNLYDLIALLPGDPGTETLHVLFTSIAGAMRLPFYGEPLKGIQIMGVLETRTLDFDTLIMLSVNEGLLPRGKRQDSFIPMDIRLEYRLPGFREHNAVFAYHFYRLLQRAKTTWLLYNTEADELGNGEKSRFITQLAYELPRYNPGAKIPEQVIGIQSLKPADSKITISKNAGTMQRLREIAVTGFSPSVLSAYVTCSLQFYYSAILGLKEPDSVDETIDASIIGNAIHHVLQKVYTPYVNRPVDSGIVRSLIGQAFGMVKPELERLFPGNDLETGKNLIIVNVAQNMIRRFLEAEAQYLSKIDGGTGSLRILYLEKKLTGNLSISADGTGEIQYVMIKGTTDRIDAIGNQIRVIDYKTGSLMPFELNLDSPENLGMMKKPQKMLQLLTYTWLYHVAHPGEKELVSGIISLKAPKKYLQKAKINKSDIIQEDAIRQFEKYLTGLLVEIFSQSAPFQQTDNPDNCKFCAFRSICNR
ncbi:MAG TPA: PD-(D/E)XK nuclease family protein [Bacteroidales bacterium]|nr:PD-(D/E)XK nuclease family protein [Bacteroidales bacterium]